MLSIVSFEIEKLAGIGFAKRNPEERPRLDCASMIISESIDSLVLMQLKTSHK